MVSSVADRSAETSTQTGTDSDESTTGVEAAAATSEPRATRRPLGMMFTDGGTRFVIDGATGDVPHGFKEKHVRDIYVFLGYNRGDGHIQWLTVVAPMTTKIGPWDEEAARMPGGPSDLPPEPAPADIRGVLDERNVPVHEWGELEIDGVVAPVLTVDGFLEMCGPSGSCRKNSANGRFYVLIPYVNGTLVVEGDLKNEVMAGDQPTAEEMDVVVDELQDWAESIELP